MTIYYGSVSCQKEGCQNMAYYQISAGSPVLCGVHCNIKRYPNRLTLPKNPNIDEEKTLILTKHNASIYEVAAINEANAKQGHVVLFKMHMMRDPKLIDGYLNVFPNFKHGNRRDGLGLPSLSPKSIGPIDHGQPGLPIAKNLENFHQGNKFFPGETVEEFVTTRLAMYMDDVPHRHKTASGGKNIPLYSVWISKDGIEHQIDYITSRQFYCTFYQRSVENDPAYHQLLNCIKRGINLRICGYDAYSITMSLEEHYLDRSKPFGHELVLYTMLVTDKKDYPWVKHRTFEF